MLLSAKIEFLTKPKCFVRQINAILLKSDILRKRHCCLMKQHVKMNRHIDMKKYSLLNADLDGSLIPSADPLPFDHASLTRPMTIRDRSPLTHPCAAH